jgi:uncharacterized protein
VIDQGDIETSDLRGLALWFKVRINLSRVERLARKQDQRLRATGRARLPWLMASRSVAARADLSLDKCVTLNRVKVEWDPQKAASNKRKHGVSFNEAVTCFADPLGVLLDDQAHPERLVLIAVREKSRVLYTVFAEVAGDVVRIITARKATTHERRRYEEEGE